MSYIPNSNHNGQHLAIPGNAHGIQAGLDFGKRRKIYVVANASKMALFLF